MMSVKQTAIADLISTGGLFTNLRLMDVLTIIMNLVVMQMNQEPVSVIAIRSK